MAILNITCIRPLIARASGTSFRKADILKSYGLPYNWNRDYNCTSEQVEYKKAVWFQMLETIQRLDDKATAANIRAEMGWGTNASRNHCDYFSTLIRNGEIGWEYKRVDGKKKPVYYLTAYGLNTLSYAYSKLPKAMDAAEKRGTKRLTAAEFEAICKKRVMRKEQAKIKAEAQNG